MASKKRFGLFMCVMIACIFMIHIFEYQDWRYYYKHQHVPLDLNTSNLKLILLWTPYQGRSKWWSEDVGHDKFVENCTGVLNNECMITRDKTYINHADMVLFSLQDLKQVIIH